MNAMRNRQEKSIGIDAIILALYFAISPVNQLLLLSNGSTVNKYLSVVVMLSCLLQGYINRRNFIVIWDLIWPALLMFGWFALTFIWADSISSAISSLISLGSYCAFMMIVGSRRWNRTEKRLFLTVLILACIIYSILLTRSAFVYKRARLMLSIDGDDTKTNQNRIACNIGLGALAALYSFLQQKSRTWKWIALIGSLVIFLGIISTGSRGGIITFVVGAGYILYKQIKIKPYLKSLIPFVFVCIIIIYWLVFDLNILQNNYLIDRFSNTSVSSMSGRIEIWEQYLELLIHRPKGFLCGYGAGCDEVAHAAYLGRNWTRDAHNVYISILCQAGIPGLLLTCSFIYHIWKRSNRDNNTLGCSYIILMVIASLDTNLFLSYSWWNAMIFAYIGLQDVFESELTHPAQSIISNHKALLQQGKDV